MRRLILTLTAVFVLLVAAACGAPATETAAPTTDAAAASPTEIPPTIAPTLAPEPTTAPEPTAEPTPVPSLLVQGTDGYPWWNDTTFYQVFVRSYYDSNGDGVGDINGLIERLDYLNDGDPTTTDDLGVTGLWLMPVMESPSYHGYDVEDYYRIDQEYGTNEDFVRLIDEAHKRGMRVIIDLVINHSSRTHPWFEDAVTSPNSEYRDWYIWSEDNPNYKGPWNQTVWHPTPTGFFYGVFCNCMPDFNYNNPDVTEAIYDISDFWLTDMNADGFRMDAIKHLIEDGKRQEFTQDTYDWFTGFYKNYKAAAPDAFAVGEAWGPTFASAKFAGDRMDVVFEFDMADATISTLRGGSYRALSNATQTAIDAYPPHQFATFLRNHDMDRTLSALDDNENKAKSAATLLLTGPGVPFIYYGEEIGQIGVRTGNTDEPRRLPLQWTAEKYTAGFTSGQPWRAPAGDYQARNIAAQDGDPNSLLSLYRKLIRIRGENEALRIGEWTRVNAGNAGTAAYLRHTDDNIVLVIVNLGARPNDKYNLDLESGPLSGTYSPVSLLSDEVIAAPTITAEGGFIDYKPVPVLEPYANYVIKLK